MNSSYYNKISKDPNTFFNSIPTELQENIRFRVDLHSYLCGDKSATANYLANCYLNPCIFFNTSLWTFNSQLEFKNLPFNLWPHQVKAVTSISEALRNGSDLFARKSRKQGATYIILGTFLLYFLINDDEKFLLGSRKENLVDDGSEIKDGQLLGSEETLFFKLLYMLNTLPEYIKPKIFKKNLFLQSLSNGAAFKGDSTSIGFGKGFRGRATLVDEAAQIEPTPCQWIIENLADTCPTSIFNSTTGPWGAAHAYSKLMNEHPTKVIELSFYDNPLQGIGRYDSPKEGVVVIKDVDYYRKTFPLSFDNIENDTPYEINDLPKDYPFICDGGISNFGCDRTAWLDNEEQVRVITPRGKAQNLLCIESGSTDLFFKYGLIEHLRDNAIKPYYTGDIEYTFDNDGYIGETVFVYGGENSILSWWGELEQGRPIQRHNYVVGCDLSKGTGTSNSVASVIDVNTNQLVGLLITPYLDVPDFAEKVVAMCEWIGGNVPPVLGWETNGAADFLKRVDELGYYNLYIRENKGGQKVKGGDKYGWRSTPGGDGTKVAILNRLDIALHEGLRSKPRFPALDIYDDQTINELSSYVWFEGKVDVGPVAGQTETSGAKAAHGDRVIAVAIANFIKKQQEPGVDNYERPYSANSWEGRRRKVAKVAAERSENSKLWWD